MGAAVTAATPTGGHPICSIAKARRCFDHAPRPAPVGLANAARAADGSRPAGRWRRGITAGSPSRGAISFPSGIRAIGCSLVELFTTKRALGAVGFEFGGPDRPSFVEP